MIPTILALLAFLAWAVWVPWSLLTIRRRLRGEVPQERRRQMWRWRLEVAALSTGVMLAVGLLLSSEPLRGFAAGGRTLESVGILAAIAVVLFACTLCSTVLVPDDFWDRPSKEAQ